MCMCIEQRHLLLVIFNNNLEQNKASAMYNLNNKLKKIMQCNLIFLCL